MGNNFYEAWLDPSMTYSAGLFNSEDETLEQAQANKYARLADLQFNADGLTAAAFAAQ